MKPAWPPGEGEMARRVRKHDWAATPLGPITDWPDRLRAVVELVLASPVVATVALLNGRLLIYNDAAARLYGNRHPGALGRPLGETFPDSYPSVAPFYDRVFAGEALMVRAQPLAVGTGDGGEIFDAYLTPVRGTDGAVIGTHMVGLEIGDRLRAEAALRESEERQAFLLALADRLRPIADPEEIRLTAAQVLGRHLGANRVAYAESDEEGRFFDVTRNYVDGVPDASGRFRYADFGSDIVDELQAGRTRVQPDVREDSRLSDSERQALTEFRVGASLNVPLVKNGRLVAFLGVNYATAHDFTPLEIELVTEVAERTWAAVERARAVAALRRSEARLAAVFEVLPVGVGVFDAHGALVLSNQDMQRFMPTGIMPSRDEAQRSRWRAWHPDGRLVEPQDFPGARALRSGRVVPGIEMLHTDDDGREVWTSVSAVPLEDGEGCVAGAAIVVAGIDALKRGAEALRASEDRLRTLVEGVPQLVWRAVAGGRWTWSSPQWSAFTSLSEEESHGLGWLAALHPDDRGAAEAAWADADRSAPVGMEVRIRNKAEGRYCWFGVRATPLRDEQGQAVEWLGTSTDIDGLKRLQAQQQVLIAELQHRTRNLLAVVRSVARRSLDPSPGRDEYDARLAALGRVQGFLSRSPHYAVPLADLVEAELAAVGDGASERVTVAGPPVTLPGEGVQTVALALHELATNAVKHGAIAQPSGRLSVTWREDAGSGRLVIDWREGGVTMPDDPPAHRGYGSELITEALPYQLDAETALEFTPEGVRCRIALPAGAFRIGEREGSGPHA